MEPDHLLRSRPRRGTVIALSAACTVLGVWSAGVTGYIVMKDDLAAGLLRRQVEQQMVYEQQVATLRVQIDRMVGRQLLDQDSVEAQVAELLTRQSAIENRHALIARLADDIGAQPKAPPPAEVVARRPAVAPADTISPALSFAPVRPTPVIEFSVQPRAEAPLVAPAAAPARRPLADRVSELRRALVTVADTQAAALRGLEAQADRATGRLRAALADVGLEPAKFLPKAPPAMGGPLVPLDGGADLDEFAKAADRVRFMVKSVVALRAVAATVPARRPLPGADVTSGFGGRSDPFTRGMAHHTGIDFRAPIGAPVKATGGGTVTVAEVRGGYGKMVEIDHGHGIVTRYAHLSSILVEEGDKVAPGATVGLVGTTGRSTGPHLHYETRLRGEATDPLHFLEAGRRHRGVF